MIRFFTLMLILLSLPSYVTAQEAMPEEDDTRNHPYQVFVRQNVDASGLDRLIFVDMLTGNENTIETYGERYTTLNESILFWDEQSQRVKVASPDGRLSDHPFIQKSAPDYRVDWVLTENKNKIAWTVTGIISDNIFTTTTYLANLDGTEQREVFTDGPRPDVRALPVAISPNAETIYLDIAHIDGIEQFTPFDLYAGIVAVNVETGEITALPDESPANCLCGADFGRGLFARLRLSADGFDLNVYNLQGQINNVIPALDLQNYTSAASVLISPDGRQAIYALARVNNFGGENQSIQSVFVLADLDTMQQEALTTRPITTFVIPVEWTEDNSAIIFTSPVQNGTWKINLQARRLERIAEATYIGTLKT